MTKALTEAQFSTPRYRVGAKVSITGDNGTRTLDPIPDGEVVSVFEDYGQDHVNVMRDNGQLRAVARRTVVA